MFSHLQFVCFGPNQWMNCYFVKFSLWFGLVSHSKISSEPKCINKSRVGAVTAFTGQKSCGVEAEKGVCFSETADRLLQHL